MKKESILFISTYSLESETLTGGRTGYLKNIKLFNNLGVDIILYNLKKNGNKILSSIFLRLSFLEYYKLKRIILEKNIKYVFFDTSICGLLIKNLKKLKRSINIVSYFHNCEAQYMYDQYKIQGSIFYLLYILTCLNEKRSCLYSDKCIFITEEDKKEVIKRYRINLKKWSVLPVMLDDTYLPTENKNGSYLLFFGTSFFANIEAAEFLIQEILPNISCDLVIAGNGMDVALGKYNNVNNLQIYGFIEDVNTLFAGAIAFVSPIFSGSGMKVKIAEALMHGKRIICSEKAIIGYERTDSIIVCNTKDEYISAINTVDMNKTFYPESRELFLRRYSTDNLHLYYKSLDDMFG